MTGAELLAVLQTLTPEELALEVTSEGCDCNGDVVQVQIAKTYRHATERELYLRRSQDFTRDFDWSADDASDTKLKALIAALPKVARS